MNVRGLLVGLLVVSSSGCRPPHPQPPPPLLFENRAIEAGLSFVSGITDESPLDIRRMVSGGIGFVDYDQDGDQDLVLVGVRGVRLYRNEMGKFTDVTRGSGLAGLSGEPQGVASADYDGDGLPDLLITCYDGVALFRNLNGGRFQNVTGESGLRMRGWTTGAAFADANGDGWLDLFVGRYVRYTPEMTHFQRNGDAMLALGPDAYEPDHGAFFFNDRGTFREATREAGLSDSHGKTLGVVFVDYDLDGDQDLYLANDQALGDFFLNDGRGRFTNIAVENGTAVSVSGSLQSGMGADWGDFDGDGRLDLVVTTFYTEPKSLYRQEPAGHFVEHGSVAGLSQGILRGTAFGVSFADFNNDGWQDLVVCNGHVQDQIDRVDPEPGYRQVSQVLLNERGFFRDVSGSAGPAFQERIVGRGLAVADYDGDGQQDVAIANFVGPPLLLRNLNTSGNWTVVRLRGQPPNRDAIGAVVTVRTANSRQVRIVQTGRSYLAAFPPEAHFGLGAATSASAEIRWPSGKVQSVTQLQLNRTNVIHEAE